MQPKTLYGILELQEDPPGLLAGRVSVSSIEVRGGKLNSRFSRAPHTPGYHCSVGKPGAG